MKVSNKVDAWAKIVLLGCLAIIIGSVLGTYINTVESTIQAPSHWLTRPDGIDLILNQDSVTIGLDNLVVDLSEPPLKSIATYQDTGSMIPTFDDHVGIYISGANPSDQSLILNHITIGDIIVVDNGAGLLVHRVVKIGYDKEGRYWRTRGDSSPQTDPDIFRDADILGVLIISCY